MQKVFFKMTTTDGLSLSEYGKDKPIKLEVGSTVHIQKSPNTFLERILPTVLEASSKPETAITEKYYPFRLWQVSGTPVIQLDDTTYGFDELTVIKEIEPWQAFGKNGLAVQKFINKNNDNKKMYDSSNQTEPSNSNEEPWYKTVYRSRSKEHKHLDHLVKFKKRTEAWRTIRKVTSNITPRKYKKAVEYIAMALCVQDKLSRQKFHEIYGRANEVIPIKTII